MEGVYFFIFLLSMVFIILAVYIYVKRAEEGLRKKDKAEVFYPQLKREMTDEKNFVATHAKNAYIQNNARPISKRICILTPSFNSESFEEFAKEIFSDLVKDKDTSRLKGVVREDMDLSQLPDKIARYDNCFLHRLEINPDSENLEMLMGVDDGESGMVERYFAVFTRKSSMKNITKGGVIAVSCPSCGAALSFEQKALKMCPYCGSPVKYAEYDWMLTSVRHIDDETVIDNRAVVENDA